MADAEPTEFLKSVALSAAAGRQWSAPYDYAAFEVRQARAQQRSALGQRIGVAALSAVGLALAALLVVTARQTPQAALVDVTVAGPLAESVAPASAFVDERWLALLPGEPAIARGATRSPALVLEDRIAWLDDSLSVALQEEMAQADLTRLRAQRAQLVDALVRVRYAEQLSTQFN